MEGCENLGFPTTTIGNYRTYNDVDYVANIIGFCGKVYPLLQLSKEDDPPTYCYNVEEVDKFIEANFKKKLIELYYGKKYTYKITKRPTFLKFFDDVKAVENNYKEHFLEERCPIFVATCSRKASVTYNARLADYEFYRIIDTYTAFQEINMFMSNLAMPEKPIPVIDDLTLSEAKGFNRYSFRKDKQQ